MRRHQRYSASANPVRFAVMAADHKFKLDVTRIAEIMAIDALAQGTATAHDTRRILFMVMMAQELGRNGIGPEVLPLCKDALSNCDPCADLVREIFEYHEAQREAATPAQYIRAIARL